MRSDERGQTLLAEQPNIVNALNDREALAVLPEGSIGRAYYDCVHAAGLSADGLIASSLEAPRFEIIGQDSAGWRSLRDIQTCSM